MERKGIITFKGSPLTLTGDAVKTGKIAYIQIVKEVTTEPHYDEVLAKAGSLIS
jgi:peroxiredoxin